MAVTHRWRRDSRQRYKRVTNRVNPCQAQPDDKTESYEDKTGRKDNFEPGVDRWLNLKTAMAWSLTRLLAPAPPDTPEPDTNHPSETFYPEQPRCELGGKVPRDRKFQHIGGLPCPAIQRKWSAEDVRTQRSTAGRPEIGSLPHRAHLPSAHYKFLLCLNLYRAFIPDHRTITSMLQGSVPVESPAFRRRGIVDLHEFRTCCGLGARRGPIRLRYSACRRLKKRTDNSSVRERRNRRLPSPEPISVGVDAGTAESENRKIPGSDRTRTWQIMVRNVFDECCRRRLPNSGWQEACRLFASIVGVVTSRHHRRPGG